MIDERKLCNFEYKRKINKIPYNDGSDIKNIKNFQIIEIIENIKKKSIT